MRLISGVAAVLLGTLAEYGQAKMSARSADPCVCWNESNAPTGGIWDVKPCQSLTHSLLVTVRCSPP